VLGAAGQRWWDNSLPIAETVAAAKGALKAKLFQPLVVAFGLLLGR